MTTDASSQGDSVVGDRSIPVADAAAEQWLGALFAAHYEPLCAFARHLGPPGWADQEDIVQQAFANLILGHSDLVAARDQHGVLKFLYKTISGLIANHRRNDRLDDSHRTINADEIQAVAGPSTPSSPDRTVTVGGLRIHLDDAVAQLPSRRREIWLLRREGMSTADVASLLGITPGTVKVQMAHAFASLRRALAPYLENAASMSDFVTDDRGGRDA